MLAKKVINNNAVYSEDELGREIIAVGKGVGFQVKTGEELNREKIERIFRFTPERNSQFAQLVAEMPYEHIQLAEEIISLARTSLQRHLNKNIYITLTDHLNFAIERHRKGIYFQNALLWEIKRFYRGEFQIGLEALELVKERSGVSLPEDEAGFIALHIVNAEMDGDMPQTANMPAIIKGMLNIVRYQFQLNLRDDTLAYERFVTHLKFFLQRAVQKKLYETEDDDFNKNIWKKYPEAYECATKIQAYVAQQIEYEPSNEEVTYLTVHIERVVKSSREENLRGN